MGTSSSRTFSSVGTHQFNWKSTANEVCNFYCPDNSSLQDDTIVVTDGTSYLGKLYTNEMI